MRDAKAVILHRIAFETADTRLLELRSCDGGKLPRFAPGAHIDVHLPDGLTRQYSLISPLCSSTIYTIAVKRDPASRGGSRWLHDEARVGDEIHVGLPRNVFALNETADDTLLLAGGIGITPIYAMFHRLLELRRPVHLYYWCRSPDDALFRSELEAHPNVQMIYSSSGEKLPILSALTAAKAWTEVYCCGPRRMLDDCINVMETRSMPPPHIERFEAETSGHGDGEAGLGGFIVTLARSNRDIEVKPGETILAALLTADVDVQYSCEEGVCGACETKVLSGTPRHRDHVRDAQEHQRRSTIMICCSGSQSDRLVLDI